MSDVSFKLNDVSVVLASKGPCKQGVLYNLSSHFPFFS
jgi:hypothetical protein